MHSISMPVAALVSRGMGPFLGVAIPVAMVVVAVSLKWIGKKSWSRSLLGAFVGFLLYPLVIGGLLWALSSEEYGEVLGWSMIFGFPILLAIGLLFLAWLGNVAILCGFGGKKAGLITGFVIMPVMWMLCFGAGANLFGLFERTRSSIDTTDAFERGDYDFLAKLPPTEQATDVWKLALERLDPKAAEIGLKSGADVNASVALVNNIPQSPLQAALDPLSAQALSLDSTLLRSRQREMIALLVKHGADVNFAGPRNEDPLGVAILKTGEPALVRSLMAAGATLSPTNPPLHLASFLKIQTGADLVALMLDAGADINFRRPVDQRTPLQCAAISANAATIQLLLQRGAQVRPMPLSSPDEAPILLALLNKRPDNALLLIENGADALARTSDGLSAWQITRDPALRKALEAKGVPREIQSADFVPEDGDLGRLLINAFSRNTSIYPVVGVFSSTLKGAGPWNMRLKFPEDAEPVQLIGVSCIEFQALGADSAGRNKNVQNSVFIGDQERPKGMRSRRIERLDAFSAQVRLGYGVTFYYEEQDPEKLEADKDWIPKSK